MPRAWSELAQDSVALAQELIRFPSVNPPGNEKPCISFLAQLLAAAGMEVRSYEFAPGRPSLVVTAHCETQAPPLCFTGHIDVVPLGKQQWSVLPFDGLIKDGKLYGRGASDMKAGVAAFISATVRQLSTGAPLKRGIKFVITAGEETGCEGAFHLANVGALGDCGLLVVAEPSSNIPILAHKGSLRIKVTVRGKTAHSSMPEVGDNAIYKAAEMITKLRRLSFDDRTHPLLGSTTACVSMIDGGLNINSVPDLTNFYVDFRTVPAHAHSDLLSDLAELLGPEAEIFVITNFSGFSTAPDDPVLQPLTDLLAERFGPDIAYRGAPYFTDASALVPGFEGVATVVLGPGEVEQCHRTDEFCFVSKIEESREIYEAMIERYCR